MRKKAKAGGSEKAAVRSRKKAKVASKKTAAPGRKAKATAKAAKATRRSAKKKAARGSRKATSKKVAKKARRPRRSSSAGLPSKAEANRALARLQKDMEMRNELMDEQNYLKRVKRFVRTRLGQKLTLARVAEVAGLEETYFSAYFHTAVGLTYSQWLSGLRVLHAVDLMQNRKLTMEEAAKKSGFGHLRTLQRSFKRRLGLPPRAYRAA